MSKKNIEVIYDTLIDTNTALEDISDELIELNKTAENIHKDIQFIGGSFIITLSLVIGYYLGTKYVATQ